LRLEKGVTRTVGLEVKNAFGRTATQSFQVSRPLAAAGATAAREAAPAGAQKTAGMLLGKVSPRGN
jgi:hypothetical protein